MKKLTLLSVLGIWVGLAFGQETWEQYDVRYLPEGYSMTIPALQQQFYKSDPWQDFSAIHTGWSVRFTERTGMPHRALGKSFYVPGADGQERALQLMTSDLGGFNLPVADLVFDRSYMGAKYEFVDFHQQFEGLRVLHSRATFRFTPAGNVAMFGLDLYPDIEVNTTPAVDAGIAVMGAKSGIGYDLISSTVLPELKILPVPHDGEDFKFDYHLVYEVDIVMESVNGVPGMFHAIVDAHTGALLSRTHTVKECGHHAASLAADVDIEATVTFNPLQPEQLQGLPYMRVNVGGTDYYTDANGMLNIPTVTGPTSATVFMDGLYADVSVGAGAGPTASFVTTIDAGSNVISFDPEATEVEIAGYYHTNIVHDFMKVYHPGFTTLDFPFTVRVDRTDGTCNAFYDGSSINFYANGGGCEATALFDDVIYHEYGHGLNSNLYGFFGGGFMNNGALNEGYADVWGLSITDYPILAQGFELTSTSEIRRYDIDPKVYPVDLIGQVHADGEIIAGAWWDFGQFVGSTSVMTDLWQLTFPATLDGPSGDEGTLYLDILIEALTQDDDDGDITNGTPNGNELVTAFALHGITFLSGVVIDHVSADIAASADPVSIEADLENLFFPGALGPFTLNWRTSSFASYNQDQMALVSGTTYNFDVPAQPEGTVLDYYFTLEDTSGNIAQVLPLKADFEDANLPLYKLIGYTLNYQEDFDVNFGDWITNPDGDDDASTGQWEVSSPVGTDAQPAQDHTDDGFGGLNLCAFTGNTAFGGGLGDNDVDAGKTSIRSTAFDASELDNPVFAVWRWWANDPPGGANPGNDPFIVEISDDGSTWIKIRHTYTSDISWRRDIIPIEDYVTASETVYLKFTTSDSLLPGSGLPFDGGSIVEAAIDDVQLYGVGEVVEPPNGITNIELDLTVDVYPNPTSGAFSITAEGIVNEKAEVEILNAAGQLVYAIQSDFRKGKIDLPDLGLAAGIYTVNAIIGDQSTSRQIAIR